MPYTTHRGGYETSPRNNHVSIVQNEEVQSKLEEYQRTTPDLDEIDISEVRMAVDEAAARSQDVPTFIGIDGSFNEVPIDDEHPADRIGFLQTAAVKVDATALRADTGGRFVDPAAVDEMVTPDKHVAVFPGANVVGARQNSVRETWRKEIYELFRTHQVQDLTFLETFQILMRYSPKGTGEAIQVKGCPAPDCDGQKLQVKFDTPATCPHCGTTVYPTDALRIHEKISEYGGNESALGRLMQVLEHLTAAAYTIYLFYRAPEKLAETMFFVDGPLAMFDVTAWFHNPLQRLYQDVRQKQAEEGLDGPLIVGIEKSGTFVDHAANVESELEPGDVLTMTDQYIDSYVLSSSISSRGYGHNTYYGHRFIGKTFGGRTHVITLPKHMNGNTVSTDPTEYTELGSVLHLLEVAKTQLYEDALIPVTLAHKNASIPGRTGSRVLRVFAEEELESKSKEGSE